jgi:hypothetical protein
MESLKEVNMTAVYGNHRTAMLTHWQCGVIVPVAAEQSAEGVKR